MKLLTHELFTSAVEFVIPSYLVLDVALAASELTLALSRRSSQARGGNSTSADRGSLRVLWVVITLAMIAGHLVAQARVGPFFSPLRPWGLAGVGLFIGGLLLRRWSIRRLGRFFTVDVALAEGHRVVDGGPYRYIRHPSYAGLLLEFAGVGLVLGSIPGWLVIMAPIFLVLRHRMRIEEAALVDALGEPYTAYLRRTKRLVPGVY